jgi:hypothetical protein
MTITVAVMDERREQDACECAIARAKEFASHFRGAAFAMFSD